MGGCGKEMSADMSLGKSHATTAGFPRGRGRRQRLFGSGKLGGRSPSVAVMVAPAMLGLVTDEMTGRRCLLDSGSQISLWPTPKNHPRVLTSGLRLIAANGTQIKAYNAAQREIKIDKMLYSFSFIFADIARPILGMDFLQKFKMTLDLASNRLVHSRTATKFSVLLGPQGAGSEKCKCSE